MWLNIVSISKTFRQSSFVFGHLACQTCLQSQRSDEMAALLRDSCNRTDCPQKLVSSPLHFLHKASICTSIAQVPLVKRTFASADETHIRVWGPVMLAFFILWTQNGLAFVCLKSEIGTLNTVLPQIPFLPFKRRELTLFSIGQAGDLAKFAFPSNRRCGVLLYIQHIRYLYAT